MSPIQPEPNPRESPPTDAAERAAALAFDPLNLPPGFLENPFPTYHLLRRHDPVHRCPDGSYFLTRYADVAAVYRDRRMLSDKTVEFRPKFGDGALFRHHNGSPKRSVDGLSSTKGRQGGGGVALVSDHGLIDQMREQLHFLLGKDVVLE